MRVDTLVNGLGLAILADRVDANCGIRTASDDPSAVGRVCQYCCTGGVCRARR